jgi:hypothetical protein
VTFLESIFCIINSFLKGPFYEALSSRGHGHGHGHGRGRGRAVAVAAAAMVVGAGAAAAAGQGAGGSSAAPAAVHRATLDTATGVQIINQYGGLCFGNAFGLELDAEQDAKGNPTENGDKVQLWRNTGGMNQDFSY